MVTYPFEGRLAPPDSGHAADPPTGTGAGRGRSAFVATDYSMAIWGLRDMGMMIERDELSLAQLFDEDMLGDDLEAWLAESWMLKRTFRTCAMISGLIERRHPGKEKTGRQVTVSADLIYDVFAQPRTGPHPVAGDAPGRSRRIAGYSPAGRYAVAHQGPNHLESPRPDFTPLAVPVMLEIGKEPVVGEAQDDILAEDCRRHHRRGDGRLRGTVEVQTTEGR